MWLIVRVEPGVAFVAHGNEVLIDGESTHAERPDVVKFEPDTRVVRRLSLADLAAMTIAMKDPLLLPRSRTVAFNLASVRVKASEPYSAIADHCDRFDELGETLPCDLLGDESVTTESKEPNELRALVHDDPALTDVLPPSRHAVGADRCGLAQFDFTIRSLAIREASEARVEYQVPPGVATKQSRRKVGVLRADIFDATSECRYPRSPLLVVNLCHHHKLSPVQRRVQRGSGCAGRGRTNRRRRGYLVHRSCRHR